MHSLFTKRIQPCRNYQTWHNTKRTEKQTTAIWGWKFTRFSNSTNERARRIGARSFTKVFIKLIEKICRRVHGDKERTRRRLNSKNVHSGRLWSKKMARPETSRLAVPTRHSSVNESTTQRATANRNSQNVVDESRRVECKEEKKGTFV